MTETTKSTEQCEAAIKEFVEITGTDEALAHFLLQDVDFNLEEAVFRFYSEIDSGPLPQAIIDEVLHAEAEESNRKRAHSGHSTTSDEAGPSTGKKEFRDSLGTVPEKMALMSWNVDGIDTGALQDRFRAVMHRIATVNPEIIFLQEMVEATLEGAEQVLGEMYHLISGNEGCPYFTVMAISKNLKILEKEVIPYSRTQMGRNMVYVKAKWMDLELNLLNTHLESMYEHREVRMLQLNELIEKAKAVGEDPNCFTVFGGDMNIRDNEISQIPKNVLDCWVAAGSPDNCKYTWDMKLNDNKSADHRSRCRFDRIFYSGPYRKINFELEGLQRLKKCQRFPSDHFAVVCKFSNPTFRE